MMIMQTPSSLWSNTMPEYLGKSYQRLVFSVLISLHSSEAKIVSMDKLGMTVTAKLELAGGGMSKVRLPFPSPVTERKAVKEVLVAMTRASAPQP